MSGAFDPTLDAFIDLATKGMIEVSVTMVVDGLLVSGTIVSFDAFVGAIEESTAERGTAFDVHVSEGMRAVRDTFASLDSTPNLNAFYVRDATLIAPGAPPLKLPWWSAKRSAISGWWLTLLKAEASP